MTKPLTTVLSHLPLPFPQKTSGRFHFISLFVLDFWQEQFFFSFFSVQVHAQVSLFCISFSRMKLLLQSGICPAEIPTLLIVYNSITAFILYCNLSRSLLLHSFLPPPKLYIYSLHLCLLHPSYPQNTQDLNEHFQIQHHLLLEYLKEIQYSTMYQQFRLFALLACDNEA